MKLNVTPLALDTVFAPSGCCSRCPKPATREYSLENFCDDCDKVARAEDIALIRSAREDLDASRNDC